jgi:ribonuclease BN (tRNA processing enzyme)
VTVNLTVLSCAAGRSSGYLLQVDGRNLLIDCGPGTVRALPIALEQVDGVVVTHEHADHCLDLVAAAYALRFPAPQAKPIPLWVPHEMTGVLEQLDEIFGVPTLDDMRRPIATAFDVQPLPLDGTTAHQVLPEVTLTSYAAQHAVPSAALRFTTSDHVIAFSSDTGPTDEITHAAHHADLFVCEATYRDVVPADAEQHGHLTGGQAGELASQANAGRLLLTHFSSPSDTAHAQKDAALAYPGPIDLATPGFRCAL